MPKKAFLLVLLLGALVRPGPAEERTLSLQEAISAALQNNPDVVRARFSLDEAKGRRLQAEARPEPQLALSTEGIPFNLKSSDTTEVNLSLEQPIEFPGKRPLRAKVGRYDEAIAQLELERAQLIVTAQVKKAYWNAVLSDDTAAALEKMTSLLDEMIDSSLVLYQAGTAAYSDVLRVRVEKARLQNEVIAARREKEASAAALSLLLGQPVGETLILTDDLDFVPFDGTLEKAKAAARASRPSLRMAALRAEQAGVASALAAKNRLPDFSLGLFFPSIRFNAWGVALGLSLPVSKSRTEGERLEAAAQHASRLAGAEAQAKRLDALVETAFVSVRAAADQVRLFEKELLSEMEEELRSGLTQYQYGKIESFSLLDLYRTYAAAKLEHLRALFLYLSGLADLEAAGEEG